MAKSILLASFIIMVTCITLAQAQVDGSWSAWNAWHTCTATCDGGVRIRFRDCDNPAPSDGGNDCPGYGMESSDCNTQGCPVDGGWTIFTAWSDCSVTCGGGTETRLRACTAPLPTNGGASCVGDSTESRSCNEDVCPTDGKWSKWGGWTECNTDCMKYRYRACDNPEPANGGRDCPGKSRENYECSLEECPVDGQWGAWSNHNCDRTCRGYKTRRCDSPPPLRGGGYCEGTNRDEYGDCTGHECVENGNWGLWTQWTKCSKTCMHGVQMRERYCTNPRPRNDGKECPEEDISHQEKPCFLQTCPVPPDYVRKVTRKQNYDINFGLILGTIFGTMAGLTVILLVTMKTRKYWLIQKRNKLVEEREQSHLYKEAAEMSIIPEGKRSAQARLRRAQLKAKLKRNGNLNEKTPLVMMDDEDGSDFDEYFDDDRPFSSMSSRPGSASSRPGSASSRPGTARLRPSAYGRENSMMHEADAELKRDMTLLDIFQDAEYLKTKSKKDSGVGFDDDGEEAMEYGGFDAPEDAPTEYGMGMVRSDTQMSFDAAGDLDSDMGHRKLLETPRPDSTRPESREMRVDTPMMMKGLQDLDEQLRQMAGFAPEGQDASAPGGITNLTQLLGGDDTDADKGMDVLGLTSNLQQPSTQQQQRPSGPGMAYSMNDMANSKATPGGTSLNNAMNQKVVLAQINQHPTTAGYKSEASGGLPNLQAAMAKKAGDKAIPTPSSSLPNPDVFSPHSSLPVITTPTMPDQGASGGVTFGQATGGKQPHTVPAPRLCLSAPNDVPNFGVTFEQATNAKQGGLASPPQQQKQTSASTNGATLGLGLSLQQAMNGKGAPLPAITPPPNRRKGVGMMLDSDMADQGVAGQKMGKSVSVDEALSSLAKPNIADAPGSPGFSPRRASMAVDQPRDTVTMINEGGRTPRGKGAMNLREAMYAKGGSAAAAHESRGKTLNEVMSAKTGQLPHPESPRGKTLHEVMSGKTGQVLPPPDSTRGMTLNEVMAGKTGQAAATAPSSGRGMNLREAMAAKTGKTADRKRGYDSVEEAMAGKFAANAAAPRKLSKQLPNLPPPDEEKMWEVPRDSIELVTTIAFGTMGPVWKAKAWDITDSADGVTSVAIKTLNDGCMKSERDEFLRELELMKKLDPHPHVVGLLGCCTYLDPLYMVLEYARHDSLLDYLRRNRPGKEEARTPTSRILINFAVQIAKGMSYLSQVKLPHGDLTTRNVLLGDRMVCKISNFSRERDITAIVEEPRHAVRWMGIETIVTHEYTTLTDIWSFGILLWEIVTYGATPYPKLHGRDVKARVPSGLRMEIPSHCSKEVYGIMAQCWNADPQKRPSFRSINIVMEKLLNDKKDYIHANKYVRKHYESPY